MTDQTTEIPEMCNDGKRFRFRYLRSGSAFDKMAYQNHVDHCWECRAHFAALDKLAEKAEMPEVEE